MNVEIKINLLEKAVRLPCFVNVYIFLKFVAFVF